MMIFLPCAPPRFRRFCQLLSIISLSFFELSRRRFRHAAAASDDAAWICFRYAAEACYYAPCFRLLLIVSDAAAADTPLMLIL